MLDNSKIANAAATESETNDSVMRDSPIGYRKPPKSSQFKKGQSGNPKGRQKELKNIQATLDGVFAETIKVRQGEQVRTMTKLEATIQSLRIQALKGDPRAARELFRRALKAGILSELKHENFIVINPAGDEFMAIYRQRRNDLQQELIEGPVGAAHSGSRRKSGR